MILVPLSPLPPKLLEKLSGHVTGAGVFLSRMFPFLQLDLDRANMDIDVRKYLTLVWVSSIVWVLVLGIMFQLLFHKFGLSFLGIPAALLLTSVIVYMQVGYPKLAAYKRVRALESDVLPALRALVIQLDAGVPLFNAMSIISQQRFGEVSKEFHEAVKQVHAGVPQIEALEDMAIKNPSPYFRRTVWQLINSMKAGTDVVLVLQDVIRNLSKEQIIQIEKYGSQLNHLVMFYMIIAVILPALGITFFIALASFVQIDEVAMKGIFWALLAFVLLFQLVFKGFIRTKRPTLLGQ